VDEFPELMVDGDALKLVISGGGTTVTVTADFAVAPKELVTVRV
jgi:hypothetical protein